MSIIPPFPTGLFGSTHLTPAPRAGLGGDRILCGRGLYAADAMRQAAADAAATEAAPRKTEPFISSRTKTDCNSSSFFCGAVNARLLMVRPNKTKPEGYMWPLAVPGGYPHTLHCSRTRRSWVRIPAGLSIDSSGCRRRDWTLADTCCRRFCSSAYRLEKERGPLRRRKTEA